MKIKLFITNRQEETPSPEDNNFQQLDLFDDENIFYENKLRELDEVGAVFNDSTNTFSVPATKRNNKILKYWFEINYAKTDLFISSQQKTFNPQKRVESYIEIDTIPYRFGRLQLENVETERGLPVSYSLTFYSEVLSLEEVFGEDTLRDLISSSDESDYEFEWTLDNVRDLMTRFSSAVRNINNVAFEKDLMMPLIFPHEGDISYKTGEDSDISENPLSTSNFRPSYKLLRLINLIEQKYGLKFDSKFFETPAFQNLYVWLNGNEDTFVQPFNLGEVVLTGDNIDLTYYSFSGSGTATQQFLPNISLTLANDLSKVHKFDNNTGIMTSTYDYKQPWFKIAETSSYRVKTFVTIQLERVNNTILPRGEVEVFDTETGNTFEVLSEPNGVVSQYFSTVLDVNYVADNTQDNTFPPETVQNIGFRYIVDGVDTNVTGINIDFATRVYSTSDSYEQIVEKFNIGSLVNFVSFPINGVKTNFSIKNNLPDVTVLDFLKGIIKQFNLIIRPKKFELIGGGLLNKRVTYAVDTFERYINSGNVLDLTQNLDLEKAISERKEVDKTISFLYEENDSMFAELQGYGNGKEVFDVDSKENREIEFGLEIALPTRLKANLEGVDTNLNMYILQDEEGEPTWTENLLIHYNNGVVRVDDNTAEIGTIKMDYSGTEFELSEVPLIDSSNSESFNQVTNDMNFSSVGSNWHKIDLTKKNQFANYFKPYLDNVYDKQNRVTNFNLNLPYNLISQLDLDSTVLIQNNQYLVEDIKINLLNGETSLKVYPSITNRFLDKTEGFSDGSELAVDSLFYGYNQGYHNSSVEFLAKSNCIIEKVDNGSGTGWVDLKTTEFTINEQNPLANQFSIVFDIVFNASITNNRSMQLKVTTDSNEYFLNIFQASGFTQVNILEKCSDGSTNYYLSPNSTFVIGGDFVGDTILPNDTRVTDVDTGDTYITTGQIVDVEGLTEIEADITDQTGC